MVQNLSQDGPKRIPRWLENVTNTTWKQYEHDPTMIRKLFKNDPKIAQTWSQDDPKLLQSVLKQKHKKMRKTIAIKMHTG